MAKSFNGASQLNTFMGGMNMDLDTNNIKSNSYSYAENIRLVTNKGSDVGSAQGVLGFIKLNQDAIPYKYLYENTIGSTTTIETGYGEFSSDNFKIIGLTTIRNYICIFCSSMLDPSYNWIFRLRLDNDKIDLTRIAYGKLNINNNEDRDMSIVSYWEDYDNIKVYWADGINPLRYINIAESSDKYNFNASENHFNANPSIAIDQPLLNNFTSGSLKVGLIQYAYQLFTKNGSESVVSPLSDLFHLTKSELLDTNYKGAEQASNSGKTVSIKFRVNDRVFEKCRVYSIHYIVANESPEIKIVSEFNINLKQEVDGLYQHFTDPGTFLTEITQEEFINLNPYYFVPKVIESKDGRLFAANITEDTWTTPGFNSDNWYDTRAFRFANNNENGIHSKLLSNSGDYSILTPEMLDPNVYDINKWKAFLPETHDCINPINTDFTKPFNRTDKHSYEYYTDGSVLEHKGGVGRNVSFKIIHTKFGEDWSGPDTKNVSEFTNYRKHEMKGFTRGVDIKINSTRNGDDVLNGSLIDSRLDKHYNIPSISDTDYHDSLLSIPLRNTIFGMCPRLNYSNPFLDTRFRSYQRDELYRVGVIFHNTKGQITPVNWIADIRMPSILEYNHRLFDVNSRIRRADGVYDTFQVVSYPMGIQFDFKNLPSDVAQVEIVRCDRTLSDRTIVTQGIIGKNVKDAPEFDAKTVRPLTSMMWTNDYGSRIFSTSGEESVVSYRDVLPHKDDDNIPYTFASSEVSYFQENSLDYLDNDLYIEPLIGLCAPTQIDWNDRLIGDGREAQAREVYNYGVFLYNSQFWFNDLEEVFNTSASEDNVIFGMIDGTALKYGGEYWMLCNSGFNKKYEDGGRPETKVKLVGKLYNPFTSYTTPGNVLRALTDTHVIEPIDSIILAENIPYDGFKDIDDGLFKQVIGTDLYQNWVVNEFFEYEGVREQKQKNGNHGPCLIFKSKDLFTKLDSVYQLGNAYVYGSGGTQTTQNKSEYFGDQNIELDRTFNGLNGISSSLDEARAYSLNATFLTNLRKNSIPYGGVDYVGRTNSTYITTGFIQRANDNKASIDTFGGDTYIGLNEYIIQHWYMLRDDPGDDNSGNRGQKAQIVVYHPCESSINLSLVHGDNFFRYANQDIYPHEIQLEPGVRYSGFVQERDLYSYNTVFSKNSTTRLFLPVGMYDETNKNIDFRVVYSDVKINDEIADSWLKFSIANYLDVDTRFGSINNLKLFNNTLLFWQDDAFGELPVNQRSLINDNNMSQLILGVGDVLTYASYITKANGSKKDVINNVVSSPGSLYWYDHHRNEILAFSNTLEPISKTKFVQSWLRNNQDSISDRMITLYDKQMNDVHFQFRIGNNESSHLIFNEQIQGFTSFYTYLSDWFIDLKDSQYSFKDNSIYKHNSNNSLNTFFSGRSSDSKLSYVINDNFASTKVFDNVEYFAEFEDNNNLEFEFETNKQQSTKVLKDDIDLREDNFRFSIPRSNVNVGNLSTIAPNYNDRMRGKYLISHITFSPDGDTIFKLPYIKTSYRISNI